jgi:hypothetical protein
VVCGVYTIWLLIVEMLQLRPGSLALLQKLLNQLEQVGALTRSAMRRYQITKFGLSRAEPRDEKWRRGWD